VEPRSLSELKEVARTETTFGLLADEEVRERIREALGIYGGTPVNGLEAWPNDVTEAQLADAPAGLRGPLFAWLVLKEPVLWLGGMRYRARSREELLGLLGEAESRSAVLEQARTGVLSAWLAYGLGKRPPAGYEVATESEQQLAELAIWLGDPVPAVQLSCDPPSLVLAEGAESETDVTVANPDPVRPVWLTLEALADALPLGLSGLKGAARTYLAPGASTRARLQVRAPAGASGSDTVAVRATTRSADGETVACGKPEMLPVRVLFPGRTLALGAMLGALGGVVLGLVYRGLRGVVIPGDPSRILRAIRLEDRLGDAATGATAVIVVLAVLAMVLQRIHTVSRYGHHPDGSKAVAGLKIAAGIGAALAPIVGCGSCLSNCSYERGIGRALEAGVSGAVWALAIAFAIGVFALARPGVAIQRNVAATWTHDLVFAGLTLLAAVSFVLAPALCWWVFQLEVGVLGIGSIIGLPQLHDEGGAYGSFAFAAAIAGAAAGLSYALAKVNRRGIGVAVALLALVLLTILAVTQGRVDPLATNSGCERVAWRTALSRAADKRVTGRAIDLALARVDGAVGGTSPVVPTMPSRA
jgi:hypothetical protein